MITQAFLKEIFTYDPDSGLFIRRVKRTNYNGEIGSIAGTLDSKGYIAININGKLNRAHRLAWLYMTGKWPQQEIDHINLKRSDNRWCNLRQASRKENGWNRGMNKNNSSGVKGVYWHKKANKWCVEIMVNKKKIYLGLYEDLALAKIVRALAEKYYFGEFAYNGVA